MGKYCKAYPANRFEEFAGWDQKANTSKEADVNERYFFLQENLVVTDGVFLDENIIYDQITPEWEAFCREKLEFRIPDFDVSPAQAETHA